MKCIGFLMCIAAILYSGVAQAEKVLRGSFELVRYLQGFPSPLVSDGNFVLEPERALIWQVVRPLSIISVISQTGLVQLIEGADPIRVPTSNVPLVAKFQIALSAAMTGNFESLTDFAVSKQDKTDGIWSAVLTPTTNSSVSRLPFSRIEIEGRDLIRKVVLFKANGDRDIVQFQNQAWDEIGFSDGEKKLIRQTGE
jgi:hypothetical protein